MSPLKGSEALRLLYGFQIFKLTFLNKCRLYWANTHTEEGLLSSVPTGEAASENVCGSSALMTNCLRYL